MDLPPLDQKIVESLNEISKAENVLILSFIAPEDAIKVSPNSSSYASISPKDIYVLEEKIETIKKEGGLPDKLHLILQTPGGQLSTSYKIASYLRKSFKFIHAFVPYEAASGGTLICLAANSITLGEFGNLTPTDPQVIYNNQRVSSYRLIEAINNFEARFGKTNPLDIPSPWQQMAEKFDPIIYEKMNTDVWQSTFYGSRLLSKSGYTKEEATSIASWLARTIYSHEHCIDIEEAKNLKLKINDDAKSLALLQTYKKYLSVRIKERVDYHIIDTFYIKQEPIKEALKPSVPEIKSLGGLDNKEKI